MDIPEKHRNYNLRSTYVILIGTMIKYINHRLVDYQKGMHFDLSGIPKLNRTVHGYYKNIFCLV